MSSSLTHWTKRTFGDWVTRGSVSQPRTHEFNHCLASVHNDALLVICTRSYEVDHITYWRVYASECDRRERVISFVTAVFFCFLLNLNIQSFTGNDVDKHLTSYLFVNGNPRYSYTC